MAFSYTEHTGDGVTTVFPFAFSGAGMGYIRESDIIVLVNGVEVSNFTFSGTNQIQFTIAPPAPAAGAGPNIMIRRVVPKDRPYADFSRGNNFGQEQMNYTVLQQLYALHEFLDGFLPEGYFVKGDMDFKGNRIVNIGDLDMALHRLTGLTEPVIGSDAVTKNYVDAFNIPGVLSAASAQAASAANSALAAAGSAASVLGASNYRIDAVAAGMTFDNVTDDSAAFRAILAAAPAGSTVVFPLRRTAYLASQVNVVNAVTIEGNGSTLRSANITPLWFGVNKQTLSGLSAAVTANSTAVVLPDASLVSVGDVLVMMSNTTRLSVSPADYKFGHVGVVKSVNYGTNTVYLRNPSPLSFTCNTINVRKSLSGSKIKCLNFDVTASTTNATSPALAIYGSGIEVVGCKLYGSDRSGYGIMVYGESISIHDNEVTGFLNTQGLSDGGRIGDGIYVAGDNIYVYHNNVTECKHCITAGDRTVVSNNLHFVDNYLAQDGSNTNTLVTNETTLTTSYMYSNVLDFHANVYAGGVIASNRMLCGADGISLRNGTGIIRDNTMYMQKFWSNCITITEMSVTSLEVCGNKAEMQGHNNDYFAYLGVSTSGLKLHDNTLKNGGLVFSVTGGLYSTGSSSICGNTAWRGVLASGTKGIYLGGQTTLNNLTILGNTLYNFATCMYLSQNLQVSDINVSGNTIIGCITGIEMDESNYDCTKFTRVKLHGNLICYGNSSSGSDYPTGISTNILASAGTIGVVDVSGNTVADQGSNANSRSMRINGYNSHVIHRNTMDRAIVDNTGTYKYALGSNNFIGFTQSWGGFTYKAAGVVSSDTPAGGVTAVKGGEPCSGTYMPTFNNISHASSFSVYSPGWKFTRVGDVVSVFGMVTVDPDGTSTGFQIAIDFGLPFASSMISGQDLSGTASSVGSLSGAIYADPSTDRGVLMWKSPSEASVNMYLHFSYLVR